QRTRGKSHTYGVPRPQVRSKTTGHLADDVHHVRVSLDPHSLRNLHAARLAHPTDIVARQVDQHDVLGAVLIVGDQLSGQRFVLFWRETSTARPRDRTKGHRVPFDTDERLG